MTENQVRYLVVGGMAVVFSGYHRLTLDLYILPDLRKENLEKMVTIMGRLGYQPRVPVDPKALLAEEERQRWKEEKGAKVFTYINPKDPFEKVDVLIYNSIPFDEAFDRKQVITVNKVPIYVASLEDLIAMKKEAGRAKDLYDIKVLERMKQEREDE